MERNKYQTQITERTYEIASEELATPRRILILEDEVDFAEFLRTFLVDKGYQVMTVENGAEGIKQLLVDNFDIIICDMLMPNLPGDLFYFAVQRTKPELCKRFIFMTGHRGEPKTDQFIRQVRGVMLWKPFPLHDLLAAIRVIERKYLQVI